MKKRVTFRIPEVVVNDKPVHVLAFVVLNDIREVEDSVI